jgi:integrase
VKRPKARELASIFADHISNFIEMKKKLGYQFEKQPAILIHFDHYLCEINYEGSLTQDLALNFATSNSDSLRNECVRKYQTIRLFSDFLSAFLPETERFNPHALKKINGHAPAHIYSDEEMTSIMSGAQDIKNPVRSITLYSIIGLTASTGMRVSEIVNLNKDDVNLETGIITIRCTKFQKDRLVPVHPTTLKVLRDYTIMRDSRFSNPTTMAFFLHMWGGRFHSHTVSQIFTKLARGVGVRHGTGSGPHFHDLRHTFAVKRLVAWYRDGLDVQEMLPQLATYMGHVHYRNTAYYLTATAELLGIAAEKYDEFLKKEDK